MSAFPAKELFVTAEDILEWDEDKNLYAPLEEDTDITTLALTALHLRWQMEVKRIDCFNATELMKRQLQISPELPLPTKDIRPPKHSIWIEYLLPSGKSDEEGCIGAFIVMEGEDGRNDQQLGVIMFLIRLKECVVLGPVVTAAIPLNADGSLISDGGPEEITYNGPKNGYEEAVSQLGALVMILGHFNEQKIHTIRVAPSVN